jgi:hypothetical protein
MIGEGQRLWILHNPQPDMFRRVNHKSAAGPERIRLSRTFGSERRARHYDEQGSKRPQNAQA